MTECHILLKTFTHYLKLFISYFNTACGEPLPKPNAHVLSIGTTLGSTGQYTCNDGHVLSEACHSKHVCSPEHGQRQTSSASTVHVGAAIYV